jgi:hypothetical protein
MGLCKLKLNAICNKNKKECIFPYSCKQTQTLEKNGTIISKFKCQ